MRIKSTTLTKTYRKSNNKDAPCLINEELTDSMNIRMKKMLINDDDDIISMYANFSIPIIHVMLF